MNAFARKVVEGLQTGSQVSQIRCEQVGVSRFAFARPHIFDKSVSVMIIVHDTQTPGLLHG